MRVIELTKLYKYDIYLKNLSISYNLPKIEVKKYKFTNIEHCQFIYGCNGTAAYFSDEININILPGTFLYIPSGTTINFKEDDKYEYYRIDFDLYDSNTNEKIHLTEIPTVFVKELSQEIMNLIYELQNIYTINHELSKLKTTAVFYTILYSIISTMNKNIVSSHSSLISNALIFMEANYQHDFTTRELAQLCNLNEHYFRHIFKKQMKMTPTEYKNMLRVNRACKELTRSATIPIGLLSDAIGFHSTQYFCEIFKKYTGYSPLQYRNNIKRDTTP